MPLISEPEIEILDETDVNIESLLDRKLIVHNDHVNTFEHVIESLIEVCKHTWEQAEQSAIIIHNKGKYAVKTGSYETLEAMKTGLTDCGISATIE